MNNLSFKFPSDSEIDQIYKKSIFFKKITKVIKNNNPKNYKKVKELHQWGHPNHYLIFMKD